MVIQLISLESSTNTSSIKRCIAVNTGTTPKDETIINQGIIRKNSVKRQPAYHSDLELVEIFIG